MSISKGRDDTKVNINKPDIADYNKMPVGFMSGLSLAQVNLAGEVAAYIKDNISKSLSVNALAELFNVSKSQLQNSVKGVFGESVYSYIKRQKMLFAAGLLCNTDKSVLQISIDAGYSNPSKFSAAFKDVTGETPLEYRKNHTVY